MFERIMEAGTGVYILWGIGILGLLFKMINSTYLKGMIKSSGNMATTKKKSLSAIRQKFKNGMSLGVTRESGAAYVEKNIRSLRLAGVPLEMWRRSGQTMCILVLMITGGAFLYYDVSWRGSPDMVTLLANATLVCAFLLFLENIFLITNKVEILKANIRDYVEGLVSLQGAKQQVLREREKPRADPLAEVAAVREEKEEPPVEKQGDKACDLYNERDSNEELLNSFLKEFFS